MTPADSRTELFNDLKSLAAAAPELRVGQLLAAIGEACADLHGRGLWDATDDEILEAVWHFRNDFERLPAARLNPPPRLLPEAR